MASLRFHKPLVITSIGTKIHLGLSELNDGTFVVSNVDGSSSRDEICSGLLNIQQQVEALMSTPMSYAIAPPLRTLDQTEVYSGFNYIEFGPQFRNIQRLDIFSDHVDGVVTLRKCGDPILDRIRCLDSCLHMFGALPNPEFSTHTGPQLEGAFLPSSLSDFVMYVDHLPDTVICRYHLPIQHQRNYHVMSTSFEVLSLTGDLLVTCKKYSVAWIPFKAVPRLVSHRWLDYTWVPRDVASGPNIFSQYDALIMVGFHLDPSSQRYSQLARQSIRIDISHATSNFSVSVGSTDCRDYSALELRDILFSLSGNSSLIIVDTTTTTKLLSTNDIHSICSNFISVLKLFLNSNMRIKGFVVLSAMSLPIAPVDICQDGEKTIPPFALGSVMHGMVSVWRNESGRGAEVVWGLDIPSSKADIDVVSLIRRELQDRLSGNEECSSIVGYRRSAADGNLTRFAPVLRPADGDARNTVERCTPGVAVITGMGSIGKALVSGMVLSGCVAVVFLGRSKETDIKVCLDSCS